MYMIRIDQGDYLQERGGYDWGRTAQSWATVYDTHEQAMHAACRLRLHMAWRVCEAW